MRGRFVRFGGVLEMETGLRLWMLRGGLGGAGVEEGGMLGLL